MAENISSNDVVSVIDNTGSASDFADRDESHPVTNPEATEDSSLIRVAETNPATDNDAGLIPVGDVQVPASLVLRSVHFEPTSNEDDELLQANLLKLLQPPAFHNFAVPATVTPVAPSNQAVISARETREELLGVVEERAPTAELEELHEAQEYVPFSYNEYEISEPGGTRYGSAVNYVPMPVQRLQLMEYEPLLEALPLKDYSQSVSCTFGLMKRRENRDRSLSFIPENFNTAESSEFWQRFNKQATSSTGLMFLVITNWQAWFLPHLVKAIPTFPGDTVLHLSETRATTMLPLIDIENGEISCIMEHINVSTEGTEYSRPGFSVGPTKAHCLPLVVWTSAMHGLPRHGYRPLVVVISASTGNISSKISSHYMQGHLSRWDRLDHNQIWIYLDLYFLFTRWDRVWGAIKENMSVRIEEVQGRRKAVSIIEQTRQLHTDNNIMISLREHLRIHKASLHVVMQRANNWPEPGGLREGRVLRTRLDDALQLLEYYDVTATSLLEQQQNLLSLAFNVETVIQGEAVARLNALAFVFLPLSLVASIFGITTFTTPPQWYPVAAIPVLIITVAIAWIANKFFESGSSKSSVRQAPRSNDVEKSPTSINDPSRIPKPLRSATIQSLEEAGFVPPRSTVQILPRVTTYNQTMSPDRRYVGSQEMRVPSSALSHTIPSTQARPTHIAPEVRLAYPVGVTQSNALPILERLHNPTSVSGGIPYLVVPVGGESSSNSPTQYIGHPIGGGDTVLFDMVDGKLIERAQDDKSTETEIRVHSRTEESPDSITTSIVQSHVIPLTTAQTAATLRASSFGRAADHRLLETIPESAEVE